MPRRLTRFTAEATRLFKIRDVDRGRPLERFTNLLRYPEFIVELRRTIASGERFGHEIEAANHRNDLARELPETIRLANTQPSAPVTWRSTDRRRRMAPRRMFVTVS